MLALFAAHDRRPRILTYHRISNLEGDRLSVRPEEFRRQLALLLHDGHRVVSLDDLIVAARARQATDRLVALTFDDGYRDNYTEAYPILLEFGLVATVFVVTGWIGSAEVFSRYRGWDAQAVPLSWDQVREMRGNGITFGSHTRTHPNLPGMRPAALLEEVGESKRELEAHVGEPVRFFCYPRGLFDSLSVSAVRAAGYTAACSTLPGPNGPETDPYLLRRTEVSGDDSLADFVTKLRGGFDLWHTAVQRLSQRSSARQS